MTSSLQELVSRYKDYLEAERRVSPYTVRNYLTDLLGNYRRGPEKGFLQFLRLKNIESLQRVDRHVVREYMGWLMEQGVVKPSIARKLSAGRSFYNFLRREGIVEVNPFEEVSSPKLDRRLPSFLSVEETVRLLQAPDLSTPQGLRDRALLELLYAAGLRVAELEGMDLANVDLGTGEIVVRGKGSRERMVLIGEPAVRALNTYIESARPRLLPPGKAGKQSAVFITDEGNRLTARHIQKLLEKYAIRAGTGKKVHPHLLRHTFATHMLDGGADLRVVQELLGHARLATTQVYTHVSQRQARKVYLAAHPMANSRDDEDNHGN